MSLAELTDVYNTAYKSTYSADDVYKDIPSLKNIKYREVDDSYSGNEDKYNNSLVLGETVFFKKDKVYITGMGELEEQLNIHLLRKVAGLSKGID